MRLCIEIQVRSKSPVKVLIGFEILASTPSSHKFPEHVQNSSDKTSSAFVAHVRKLRNFANVWRYLETPSRMSANTGQGDR